MLNQNVSPAIVLDPVQDEQKTLEEDRRRQEAADRDRAAMQKLAELQPPAWLAAEGPNYAGSTLTGSTAVEMTGQAFEVRLGNFVENPAALSPRLHLVDAPQAQAAAIQKIERALEAFQKEVFQTGEKHGAAVGSSGEFGRLGVGEQNLSGLSLGSVELRNLAMLAQLEGLLENPVVKANSALREEVESASYKMREVVEQERKAREQEEITRAFAASEARQRGMDFGWGDLRMPAAGNLVAGRFGGQGVAAAA